MVHYYSIPELHHVWHRFQHNPPHCNHVGCIVSHNSSKLVAAESVDLLSDKLCRTAQVFSGSQLSKQYVIDLLARFSPV